MNKSLREVLTEKMRINKLKKNAAVLASLSPEERARISREVDVLQKRDYKSNLGTDHAYDDIESRSKVLSRGKNSPAPFMGAKLKGNAPAYQDPMYGRVQHKKFKIEPVSITNQQEKDLLDRLKAKDAAARGDAADYFKRKHPTPNLPERRYTLKEFIQLLESI